MLRVRLLPLWSCLIFEPTTHLNFVAQILFASLGPMKAFMVHVLPTIFYVRLPLTRTRFSLNLF